ncbi:MAG: phosphoribosylglycinamide formyltransferase [Acidobacteriota bacterium]|nr:phosphoribosylglycinamide formyltransferase [Acidobacteriota bacterium]
MKNFAILISGRGSNLQAIASAVQAGKIPARISIVVSNRPEAAGLAYARQIGLNALSISSSGRAREAFEQELAAAVEAARADHICLAGFMRVLSPQFVRNFRGRILNIHPSLLPSFPGLDAQKQALEYGVKLSGCTVHFLDEGVDTGPVILQAVTPVRDDDTVETLSARILAEEHKIYPEAVRLLAEDRIEVQGRRVLLKL